MNPLSGITVAEGWWCANCEMFESEDDVNTETEVCIGCGCFGGDHVPAEVMAK